MVNLAHQHDLIDTSRKLVMQVFSERFDHEALLGELVRRRESISLGARPLGGHFLLLVQCGSCPLGCELLCSLLPGCHEVTSLPPLRCSHMVEDERMLSLFPSPAPRPGFSRVPFAP